MKLVAFAIALIATSTVNAASFDCGKAGTKVEHIICDRNPYLSQWDEKLNVAYQELLRGDKVQAEKNRQSQREWLKVRNACDDANCVSNAYISRLKEVAALLKATPGYKPKHRFTVSQGKGWSVCESYARYLNSLPESTPLPLCHIPRYPDFPDLKEPDWELLDITSNLELVYTLEKILSPSMHDRPVDTFDHWKTVFEQQIQDGVASPRLRRTRLKLLDDGPLETILAYDTDKNWCDRDLQRQGYAYRGAHTSFFVWNEQEQKIEEYRSRFFYGVPFELLLYQGKPLLFLPYWGGGSYPFLMGGIEIYHIVSSGIGNQYGSVSRCTISFDLPETIIERMTK